MCKPFPCPHRSRLKTVYNSSTTFESSLHCAHSSCDGGVQRTFHRRATQREPKWTSKSAIVEPIFSCRRVPLPLQSPFPAEIGHPSSTAAIITSGVPTSKLTTYGQHGRVRVMTFNRNIARRKVELNASVVVPSPEDIR